MFNCKTRYETWGLLFPFLFVNFTFREYEEIMEVLSLYIAVVRWPNVPIAATLYNIMLCAHILTVDFLLIFPANSFSLTSFAERFCNGDPAQVLNVKT
jgi:hypothetical protein